MHRLRTGCKHQRPEGSYERKQQQRSGYATMHVVCSYWKISNILRLLASGSLSESLQLSYFIRT